MKKKEKSLDVMKCTKKKRGKRMMQRYKMLKILDDENKKIVRKKSAKKI